MKESTKLHIAAFVAGVLLALLFVLPADAVTPEQIAAQQATVAVEQSKLDSLLSLALADQLQASLIGVVGVDSLVVDSTLVANNVHILVDAKPFDAMYVCIDVPFSSWPVQIQGLWDLGLMFAPEHTKVAAGRYAVRQDRVTGFLAATKSFLQNL